MTVRAVVHLTLTGPHAGQPFCDVTRIEAGERGDTFAHVPYADAAAFLARPDICPACVAEWNAAGDDDGGDE